MLNGRALENLKAIAKDSLSLLFADLIYRLSNVTLLWLIALYLGPASAGIYTLGSTLRTTFQLMTLAGTGYLIIREISQGSVDARKYLTSFTLIRVVLSIGGWLLLWGTIKFVKISSYPGARLILLLMGLELLPESIREIYRSYFIAQRYIALYALIAVATGFSRLAVSGWLIVKGKALIDVVGTSTLITWGGNWLGFLTLLHTLNGGDSKTKAHLFSIMWKQFIAALPFVSINILLVIYSQSNVYLLSTFNVIDEVGVYGVADSIVAASSLFTQVYLSLSIPLFSKWYKDNRQQFELVYHRSMKVLSSLAFPIALVLAFQADTIAAIFGRKFQSASPVISLLIWSLAISWLNAPNSCVMIAIGYESISARFLALALSINLLAGLLLIPIKGAMGAALARVIAETVFWIVHWCFVYRNVVKVPVNIIGQPLIALIAMGFTMFLLSHKAVGAWVATTVSILVYGAVMWFWVKVTKHK
mgnify:CR=1 FL=1